MTSSSSDNKRFIGRYLQALSGQAKPPELVARFVADQGWPNTFNRSSRRFPGTELIAEEVIAERDLVAMRGTFAGVHRGPFAGVEPTGLLVSASADDFLSTGLRRGTSWQYGFTSIQPALLRSSQPASLQPPD